jgi:PmbA protein
MNTNMDGGGLGAELSQASEWVEHATLTAERQVYWRKGERHAEREIGTKTRALHVFVDTNDQRGAAVCYLEDRDGDRLRVKDALSAARLALNPIYRLPVGAVTFPTIQLGEELANGEVLASFGTELQARVRAMGATVSHLELFARQEDEEIAGSNGRVTRWRGTRYEMDLVLAAGPGDRFEHRLLRRARRLSELLPAGSLEEAVEVVRDRERAVLPPTGRMAVILPAAELSVLLEVMRARVSAEALYQKFFAHKVGDRLITPRQDSFSLAADALRPYAVASAPTDTSTVPAGRVSLIEDGVVVGLLADPQYGAYLGVPPTGPAGTLVWEAGHTAAADLLGDGPVLEVVAFSATMPNPATGDLAAEIKSGYLHEGGRRTPVAQGSVSGNVLEFLANCRASRETAAEPGFFGPARVRFEEVQVAGGS